MNIRLLVSNLIVILRSWYFLSIEHLNSDNCGNEYGETFSGCVLENFKGTLNRFVHFKVRTRL